MTTFRAIGLVAAHEVRLLIADRTLWVISVLFLLLVTYGLFNGTIQATLKEGALASVLEAEARGDDARRALLDRITNQGEAPGPFSNPADPSRTGGSGRYAYMPIFSDGSQ